MVLACAIEEVSFFRAALVPMRDDSYMPFGWQGFVRTKMFDGRRHRGAFNKGQTGDLTPRLGYAHLTGPSAVSQHGVGIIF